MRDGNFLNSLSEQWDGPAAIAATDGEWVIGGMDRNGLRPLRYTITKDGMIMACSESGMIDVPDTDIIERGRLGPGDILGIHLPSGKLYRDRELKDNLAAKQPQKLAELQALLAKIRGVTQPTAPTSPKAGQ